jgi:ATP-dependent RNA helicase DDX47/RRP3
MNSLAILPWYSLPQGKNFLGIFLTCSRKDTQRLSVMLRALGFGAVPLHGQLSQDKRMGSLNKFSAGERPILIATDVASR